MNKSILGFRKIAIPGTGDKIERVVQPVAKTIDAVLGTKLAGCGGCAKMKERLNAGMTIAEALKQRILDRVNTLDRMNKINKMEESGNSVNSAHSV